MRGWLQGMTGFQNENCTVHSCVVYVNYRRLRTAIGKEIERMIERWRRDWVGFGERGA